MTSVDACGVTFVSKHNYLPLLTGVLKWQIGFASPKITVSFFGYQELYGSIHLRVITDMKFILYVKDYDMWSLNMPLSLTCFHALKLWNIVTKS